MKNVKTLLFASLIAMLILPLSGLEFVNATDEQTETNDIDKYYAHPPTETNATKIQLADVLAIHEKLAIDREKLTSQLQHATGDDEQKILKQLERLEMMQSLADIQLKIVTDPKNTDKYNEEGSTIAQNLANSFDDSEREDAVILSEDDVENLRFPFWEQPDTKHPNIIVILGETCRAILVGILHHIGHWVQHGILFGIVR